MPDWVLQTGYCSCVSQPPAWAASADNKPFRYAWYRKERLLNQPTAKRCKEKAIMKARTQLWPCIPELIYEWYSDVMPDRFVGYMMRRRFAKCSFHVPSRWRWNYHASWAIWCSLRQSRFRWSQSAGAPPLCCFPCLSQWGVLGLLSTRLCKLAFFINLTIYFYIFTQRLWKTKKNIDMHTIVAIFYI